jgi:hypothetical protein
MPGQKLPHTGKICRLAANYSAFTRGIYDKARIEIREARCGLRRKQLKKGRHLRAAPGLLILTGT